MAFPVFCVECILNTNLNERSWKICCMEKIRVLVDTDIGDDIDDAAAIMILLNDPRFEIIGFTTAFKDTSKRAEMLKDLLSLYGKEDIPVFEGYKRSFIERSINFGEPPIQYELLRKHYDLSVHERAKSADRFIIESLEKDPSLTILALAPLTNLAMACVKAPEIMKNARIIGMGGAFLNTKPEWNIQCDPEAAWIVFDTCRNILMMGLDVTKYLKISEDKLREWRGRGDNRMDYFLKCVKVFTEATGYPVTFHDVLPVFYLMDQSIIEERPGEFTVELAGKLTRGTLVDKSNYYVPNPLINEQIRYAYSVDIEKFFNMLAENF